MQPIPLQANEFKESIATILYNPIDLGFESPAAGKITIAFLTSFTNKNDLQIHFLAPIGQLLQEKPNCNWEKLLPVISEEGRVVPADWRRLELTMQRVLEPKISRVIKKLQSYNSDIINFGEEFRVQHLKQWQKQQWKQIFPKVHFKVIVKAKIERDGTLR